MVSLCASSEQNPDVSVVIPTYNRCSMLEEAIASVLAQQFEGTVEIIVVDDNSQDGTADMIRQRYPSLHLMSLSHNIGPSAARNRAISVAQGKYIAFLDSDDLWEPNYLQSQMIALEGQIQGFGVSDLLVWDTAANRKRIRIQRPNFKKYCSPVHHLLVSNFIQTLSSVVVPRLAFEQIGYFDEKMRTGEDGDLYIRCIISGYAPIFTNQPGVIKREHGKAQLTDTRNLKLMEQCRFRRIKKFYASSHQNLDTVPARQQVYSETYLNFAKQYFKNNDVLNWLISYLYVAFNTDVKYAITNMKLDVKKRYRAP
ncbi:MAG: glycosyltransferase [Cyanothece sp. SIO1E1]|nr:glycosyltransferase [Cyanothece sp. SIO1E1]